MGIEVYEGDGIDHEKVPVRKGPQMQPQVPTQTAPVNTPQQPLAPQKSRSWPTISPQDRRVKHATEIRCGYVQPRGLPDPDNPILGAQAVMKDKDIRPFQKEYTFQGEMKLLQRRSPDLVLRDQDNNRWLLIRPFLRKMSHNTLSGFTMSKVQFELGGETAYIVQ